jgi:short-subunit dehydrogenase
MASPKCIILTGASRGIGLAIAEYLLKASHNVFLVARTAPPMEELKKTYPDQVEFLAADLKDFEVCSLVHICIILNRVFSPEA